MTAVISAIDVTFFTARQIYRHNFFRQPTVSIFRPNLCMLSFTESYN